MKQHYIVMNTTKFHKLRNILNSQLCVLTHNLDVLQRNDGSPADIAFTKLEVHSIKEILETLI